MKILFDTNLWISFMIGKRLSSIKHVLCRHDVEVYVCEQLLDEIRMVISRPKFDTIIPKKTRNHFFEMVYDVCFFTDITVDAISPIRDIKDLYLLSMAESVPVDYIVSGDNDLIDLNEHKGIPILTYNQLIAILQQNTQETI
ncbi:MAG: putative toxin-antitoxin system toxin component, PIN family [Bacteroidales bacterium]|nr:putative toxin-antitoxin system toxin component, PIN family [Bacteroidales bacterium]